MQDDAVSPQHAAGHDASRSPLTGWPADEFADDPTAFAYLKVTTVGPTTVEARGTVPLICIGAILGAVAIAYIAARYAPAAALAWFLGLATLELMLSGLVILRVTRRPGRQSRPVAPVMPDERPPSAPERPTSPA